MKPTIHPFQDQIVRLRDCRERAMAAVAEAEAHATSWEEHQDFLEQSMIPESQKLIKRLNLRKGHIMPPALGGLQQETSRMRRMELQPGWYLRVFTVKSQIYRFRSEVAALKFRLWWREIRRWVASTAIETWRLAMETAAGVARRLSEEFWRWWTILRKTAIETWRLAMETAASVSRRLSEEFWRCWTKLRKGVTLLALLIWNWGTWTGFRLTRLVTSGRWRLLRRRRRRHRRWRW